MERFPALTRTRLKQLAGDMKALIYPQLCQVDKLLMSGPTDRINYNQATKLNYKPVKLGQPLGPLWSTFWFRIEAKAPPSWAGKRIDLLWNSLSEATLWRDGKPVQGLNFPYGERPDVILTEKATTGQKFSFYVEMACNTAYGVWLDDKSPHAPPFSLERCELALFDPLAWEMYLDFVVLQELEAELVADNGASDMTFAGTLLFELNRFANEYDLTDKATWTKTQKILKDLYKNHNPSSVHHAYAVGHGHLDTAWLWPIAETYRKLLRTWTNQLGIMEAYSDYKFACSAAFHYQAMKERHADVYKRAKEKVKDGRWIPVGGTWIEPDCNMPSGESLSRQFLYGQRFFAKEFGKRCREFFNPDVFGYSGQLPQIMKLVGIDYFITSKLHENELNKPLYNTFVWQGIDGSEVITHFPPLRFFNVSATVPDMRDLLKRFRDHDRSSASVILYGYGDGGGGPTKEMVERLRRYRDLQSLPQTVMGSPQEYFSAIASETKNLQRHTGEIYFEYHRGTYTSQSWIKKANRQAEFLLHDIEFLSAVASRTRAFQYPQAEIESLWKSLLLNQMHDILPGSSIKPVYEDARKDFANIQTSGHKLKEAALAALIGEKQKPASKSDLVPINTIPFERHGVCKRTDGKLVFIRSHAYGPGEVLSLDDLADTLSDRSLASICPTVTEVGKKIVLENLHLRAEFTRGGDLVSLIEKPTRREVLAAPGNRLQIFDDKPAVYDAWQLELYHLKTMKECPPADSYSILGQPTFAHRFDTRKSDTYVSGTYDLSTNQTIASAPIAQGSSNHGPSIYALNNHLPRHESEDTYIPANRKSASYTPGGRTSNAPRATTQGSQSRRSRALPRSSDGEKEQHLLRVEVQFNRRIGKNSSMSQIVRLDAASPCLEFHCRVNWQEKHKVLKVLFPVNVQSMNAAYDIQFGAIDRPTHFNTSFDLAKFEVCAHKWADLSEHGFGVALLNNCKYGHSVFANEMRITLLRAPQKPDDTADIGEHEFSYAIMPHAGTWQESGVVAEAYRFNVPVTWAQSTVPLAVRSFFATNDNNLVLDTVKKAEDSEALILRLYECHGARGTARLQVNVPFSGAVFCNILEDEFKTVKSIHNELIIPYEPFQIISLKLT